MVKQATDQLGKPRVEREGSLTDVCALVYGFVDDNLDKFGRHPVEKKLDRPGYVDFDAIEAECSGPSRKILLRE
jgi:hypothetical protein